MIRRIYSLLFIASVIFVIFSKTFGSELLSFDYKAFINGFNNIPTPTDHLRLLSYTFNELNRSIELFGSFIQVTDFNRFGTFNLFQLLTSLTKSVVGFITTLYYIVVVLFDNVGYLAMIIQYIFSFLLFGQ